MDYTVRILLLAAATAFGTVFGEVDVFGQQGGTIRFDCGLPVANVPDVEWVDRVYGAYEKPKQIFHSHQNSQLKIQDSHPNRQNYNVNDNFALTISNLDIDSDVGEYICISRVGTHVHRKIYYLTIGEPLSCSGVSHLKAGEETTLSCEVRHSGRHLTLEWFEGDSKIESRDDYDIRLAKKVVSIHATHRQDGVDFRCQMSLGDTVEECRITLNVTYPVRHPKFHPAKEVFHAGDELKCTAKGNPIPTVALTPDLSGTTVNGSGWAAVIIEQSWEGQQKTFECSASNVVEGAVVHAAPQQISFFVAAPTKPVHHHRTHHHHHHSTTPVPPIHKKDETNHPADERIEHAEKEESHSGHNQKHVPEQHSGPVGNVKPVKSDHSSGNLLAYTSVVLLMGLLMSIFI